MDLRRSVLTSMHCWRSFLAGHGFAIGWPMTSGCDEWEPRSAVDNAVELRGTAACVGHGGDRISFPPRCSHLRTCVRRALPARRRAPQRSKQLQYKKQA